MIFAYLLSFIMLFQNLLFANGKKEDYYIDKINEKFNTINDYKVDMTIKIEVPAFRMPKKKYKVFYKKPDKIKIKSKGFGILPKTGLFTSPNDNFDNLKNIKLAKNKLELDENEIMMIGDLIVDSLKLEMPNEYSRITFDPIVEVKVDTLNWVIKNVTTKLDTLKLFQINNYYEIYSNEHYMPKQSVVKYYIKDKKLFNWLNKDAGNIINQGQELANKNNSIVEGTITVNYKNYKINKGIKDKVFD
tara:strand:+ start:436 stop:1173 length:738 start_codon:yes stop_codon:yes gene_type:complete